MAEWSNCPKFLFTTPIDEIAIGPVRSVKVLFDIYERRCIQPSDMGWHVDRQNAETIGSGQFKTHRE
jgi:hypothetical protein